MHSPALRALFAALALALAPCALGQGPGGLYVAGVNFTLTQAVVEALADNPAPQGRFFILALPPATADLAASGVAAEVVRLRGEAVARGAQFLVCRRDVAKGLVDPARLVPGVGIVWGWSSDRDAPQPDARGLFPGEEASWLPESQELVRRIRSACAS